jgi:hypothetical protein
MNRITDANTSLFTLLDVWQILGYLKLEVPKEPKIMVSLRSIYYRKYDRSTQRLSTGRIPQQGILDHFKF